MLISFSEASSWDKVFKKKFSNYKKHLALQSVWSRNFSDTLTKNLLMASSPITVWRFSRALSGRDKNSSWKQSSLTIFKFFTTYHIIFSCPIEIHKEFQWNFVQPLLFLMCGEGRQLRPPWSLWMLSFSWWWVPGCQSIPGSRSCIPWRSHWATLKHSK